MGRFRKKRWTPVLFVGCPEWQASVRRVTVEGDLQTMTFAELDYLFAVFASNGNTQFSITCSGRKLTRWMDSVKRRSVGAAEKYERRIRASFRRYKMLFVEGYSLPERPTPELRLIYDSAALRERRRSDGAARRRGFSGREFHWRGWPLDNVTIKETREGGKV
jgi:hypothetical protein